ncbi:Uncharacterised protein [Acholeplasma hippikon]|uniref:Uncharacterized protein n=1 Tax=Acholeplasma hippikon TaxID=264636 RepID=A0A449BK06_9MOLU|nr:Uncharacterised protein [Acholeplasma hippikon]
MIVTSFIMGLFSLTILAAIKYSMRANKLKNTGEKIFFSLCLEHNYLF